MAGSDNLWERVEHPRDAGDWELRERILDPKTDADAALSQSYLDRGLGPGGARSSDGGGGFRKLLRQSGGYERAPDPGDDPMTAMSGSAELPRERPGRAAEPTPEELRRGRNRLKPSPARPSPRAF